LSDTRTRGVRIQVESEYDAGRSSPSEGNFFFVYRVRISNEGEEVVRLLSRRWVITDADGDTQIVEGPGVVGETPRLEPGAAFEYASFCPLRTAVGAMEGHYVMQVQSTGETFEARIAPFTLSVPGSIN
jgi:ApaG protein